MPSPLTDAPALSPCVLVLKTPVASRQGMAHRLARSGRRLAGQVEEAAREQERTLAAVETALARHGVEPVRVSVDALDARARRALGSAALVITVGGDGTLLSASHWVRGAALLGVNSAPRSSVGSLTFTHRAGFAAAFAALAQGSLRPTPVTRLAIELDGHPLQPALNDVLIAHSQPAATSRYRLFLGRQSEEQRSSGLWVSTPVGSTAGIRSAGGSPMPLGSRRLQFRARELYRQRGMRYALLSGFIPPGGELAIESAMEAGWLYLDGSRLAARFPFGARAVVRAAPEPLRLFADRDRWRR